MPRKPGSALSPSEKALKEIEKKMGILAGLLNEASDNLLIAASHANLETAIELAQLAGRYTGYLLSEGYDFSEPVEKPKAAKEEKVASVFEDKAS